MQIFISDIIVQQLEAGLIACKSIEKNLPASILTEQVFSFPV